MQRVEFSLAIAFLASTWTLIFTSTYIPLARESHVAIPDIWWEVIGKVNLYNLLRTRTNSWGQTTTYHNEVEVGYGK